jgi:hypothetical protein
MFAEVKDKQFTRVDNAELVIVVVDNPGNLCSVLQHEQFIVAAKVESNTGMWTQRPATKTTLRLCFGR